MKDTKGLSFHHCKPKLLPPVIQKLLDETRKPVVRIKYNDHKNLSLTNSKLGGVGYLPASEVYPVATDGAMLTMLCQINFAEVTAAITDDSLNKVLPKKGLLQVFVDGRKQICKSGSKTSKSYLPNSSYQVRFWEDLSEPVNIGELDTYIEILSVVGNQDPYRQESYGLPLDISNPIGLSFLQEHQSIQTECIEYEKLDDSLKIPPAGELAKIIGADSNTIKDWEFYEHELQMNYPASVLTTYGYEELSNKGGSHLLGYGFFVQGDTRVRNPEIEDFILLFQMNSDIEKGVMWGEFGLGHFFIHPKDLAAHDFSKLGYYWPMGI